MARTQIFLIAISGKTCVLFDMETVGDLKVAAAAAHGVEETDLRLWHATRSLSGVDADTLLSELGIGNNSNVFASGSLLGGGKKGNTKTYTKLRKIRHKHEAVKLAVVKYCIISANGKIEMLLRECSVDSCGTGVFMASHSDLVYCGKCGLIYVKS